MLDDLHNQTLELKMRDEMPPSEEELELDQTSALRAAAMIPSDSLQTFRVPHHDGCNSEVSVFSISLQRRRRWTFDSFLLRKQKDQSAICN